jgi:hypothetical protein
MSKTKIPEVIKLQLWVLAGGRCEYRDCNKLLWRDDMTLAQMNKAYIAHIIADSPKGCRGDSTLSKTQAKNISNLMLLCDECHRRIDKAECKKHTREILLEMKLEHEQRIELVTDIRADMKTHILRFISRIDGNHVIASFEDARLAVVAERRQPAEAYPIDIDLTQLSIVETDPNYWNVMAQEIKNGINGILRNPARARQIKHISLFPFGQIPLLVYLGRCLGDKIPTTIHQLQRNDCPWTWQPFNESEFSYVTVGTQRYTKRIKNIAITCSLSGRISKADVKKVVSTNAIYEISLPRPSRNFLKSREQLEIFSKEYFALLDQITDRHGQDCTIHQFSAVPIAVAVEMGRQHRKHHPDMKVYDYSSKTIRHEYALTLQGGYNE